jgi:pimeloyl-ACP methyl ester carboxylesterase
MFAAPWGARGYVSDLDGPVHWVEFPPGESPDGTPIVFVHGLGGSHLNWCLIGPKLADGHRAVALDLHGFGLTPGTRETATVQRNTRLLDRFVREVTGTPVILAGNSMGGLISLMQAAAAPETVRGLVLIDPALPPPRQAPDRQVAGQFLLYALPGLGELYVRTVMSRRPPELAVQRVIELCFADPSRADPAMLTASIALAAERRGQEHRNAAAFLAASRSLMRVVGQRDRYWEMMASVRDGSRSCSSAARPTGWCRRRACARRPYATRAGRRSCCPESGTPRNSRFRRMSSAPCGSGWAGPTPAKAEDHRRNGKCSSSPAWMPRSSPSRQPTPPATSGG